MKFKAQVKLLRRLLLFSVIVNFCIPAHGFGWGRPVASIKEAKKANTYLESIEVEPRQFDWGEHRVEIAECWLDNSGKTQTILFRLKIDGKWLQESRLNKREDKRISFERKDRKFPVSFFYCVSKGLTGQQRIYYIKAPFDLDRGVPVLAKLTRHGSENVESTVKLLFRRI